MSATISSLTFVRKGRLEWRHIPRPRLQGRHEALVRPIVASRCDGDCLFLFHGLVTPRVNDWADAPEAFLEREAAKVVVARADAGDPLGCSAVEVGAL